MDKQQARNIIKDTFEQPFDKGRFALFAKNLLNRMENAPFIYRGQIIPDSYKDLIESFERIGKYNDGENKLDIVIVKLKRETSLERARTMQRNFIAWYLNGSRGGELKDAALAAFISPDEADWRFSLVKMDYTFDQTKAGKVKVKQEFTPARRWSFLVGANEKSHTAQSRLEKMLADDEQAPTLAELEEAFNIETVTKEFFLKYRDLFIRTKEALDKVVKNDDKIKDNFNARNVNTVDFAKKLLGQIIFLYFLQKKGWFGVARDAEWGTGTKQFLRELFDGKHGKCANFFNDVLEPLFYDALRIDRSDNDDYYSKFNCKIPFLNGGLFDPIGGYDWVHTDICLPDHLLSNKNRTPEGDSGDGILDIFDRYNFTVKEDEPLEKEVAIDPELLGKAYEKFNAIRPDNYEDYKKALKSGKKGEESKFNKKYGVYYTPREIVHYMCRQSLINYLFTKLNAEPASYEILNDKNLSMFGNEGKKGQLGLTAKHKPYTEILMKDIDTFIIHGELVVENEAMVMLEKRETKTYKYMMPASIRDNAERIDQYLVDVTVCDPAVGSGAFPVGMMNEIVKARNVLSTFITDKENRKHYDFKRKCIEHSLYGVDIDPGAVEIAKLRLWLSLVVDEQNIKNIKPLPNLDYKIVCGDSLSGVEKNIFNNQLFIDLEKCKPLYFNETNPTKKNEYKKQIESLISKITIGHKEFDFEIYFSEVYHKKKGFDVVIANPPYVSYGLRGGQSLLLKEKEFFKRKFPNSAEYKISLYAVFMDKAIQICEQNGGLQTLIVPDSFLLGRYFSKIRKYILQSNEIVSILLLPYDVFDATVGFSVIYLFQKKNNVNPAHNIKSSYAINNEMVQNGTFKSFSYAQNIFNGIAHKRFRLFFDKKSMDLVFKIERDSSELGSIVRFSSGLIGKNGQDNIISDTKKGGKWLKGIISGSEINRYTISPEGNYLLYEKAKIKSGYECVEYFKEKLILRQTGDSLICAFDKDGLLALNNVHIGNSIEGSYSLKYITAIINSRLLNYYYKTISLEAGRVMAQTDIETIDCLPIRKSSDTVQKQLIGIVDNILTLTQSDNYIQSHAKQIKAKEYENQIDDIVYKLYDLTEEEIRIVKGVV